MKKLHFFILFLFFITIPLVTVWSIEIDTEELESPTNTDDIVFINFNGPHAVINTMEQIIGIGTALAEQITLLEAETSGTVGETERYAITRNIDTTGSALNAEILVLGPSAGVDHIRNLRAIISGYLVTAYEYTQEQADSLARFITVYNAVYRSDSAYFASKYNPSVLTGIETQNLGLSTNYEDWAGGTNILIPLTAIEGALSPVETSVISDEAVIENLSSEPDMAVEDRAVLADLKEQEADQASELAQDAAKSAATAQEAAASAQQAAVVAQQAAVVAQQAASTAQEAALEEPENSVKQEEAITATETALKVQEEAEQIQQQALNIQQQANEMSQEATEQQTFADKKLYESQQESVDIQNDAALVAYQQSTSANIEVIPALKLTDDKKLFSSIVLVNKTTGHEITASPVNQIRGRTIIPVEGGFLAIAGENKGRGAVRLVLIDDKTLEIKNQSYEQIAENAVLTLGPDGMYYTIIQNGKQFMLVKYNAELLIQARSSIYVMEGSPITFSGDSIIVTDETNTIQYLRSDTLRAF